jgi:hypothetical protein
MNTSNADNNARNHEGHDDDDDQKEFNGMDVEDWLVKQQALAERISHAPTDESRLDDEALNRKQSTPHEVIDSVGSLADGSVSSRYAQHDRLEKCNPPLNSNVHATEVITTTRVPKYLQGLVPGGTLPGAYVVPGDGATNSSLSRCDEDQMLDEEVAAQPSFGVKVGTLAQLPVTSVAETLTRTESVDPSAIIDAESRTLDSYEDFFVVEVSTNDDRGVMVIEGVTTMHPKQRRILTILGVFAVASLIATGAGLITNLFMSCSRGDSIVVAGGGNENTTLAPVSTPIISRGGKLSLTIGDAIGDPESSLSFTTGGIESFVVYNGAFELLQARLTQSDTNFTFFLASIQADSFPDIDISHLLKALSPMYNGHVVSKTLVMSSSRHCLKFYIFC